MIDNDPNKLISSKARDIGVSGFFIWQEVQEDIRYFSYKMKKKRPIFITGHQGEEEKLRYNAFEQIQASLPTEQALFFLRWEKYLPRSDNKLHEKHLGYFVSITYSAIDENQTSSLRNCVWGDHKKLWCYASIQLATNSIRKPGRVTAYLHLDSDCWKNLCSVIGLYLLSH